jgi:anthranilate synthase component I
MLTHMRVHLPLLNRKRSIEDLSLIYVSY